MHVLLETSVSPYLYTKISLGLLFHAVCGFVFRVSCSAPFQGFPRSTEMSGTVLARLDVSNIA